MLIESRLVLHEAKMQKFEQLVPNKRRKFVAVIVPVHSYPELVCKNFQFSILLTVSLSIAFLLARI